MENPRSLNRKRNGRGRTATHRTHRGLGGADAVCRKASRVKGLSSFSKGLSLFRAVLFVVLISLTGLMVSCSEDDNKPVLKGFITSYNEFGGAMLDCTESDMRDAGFSLGDLISITVKDLTVIMPYYDGYYGRNGEFLCVAYPSYPSICFTANNIGLPDELMGLEGYPVVVKLEEKGGRLNVQQALSMKYTNDRADYPDLSDAQFANARVVKAGNIAAGLLHRSSSPFSDDIHRAQYVSAYMEDEGVRTVLNLADTDEKIVTYDMPTYSYRLWDEDHVILCPLKADPTADDYNRRLIDALIELPSHPVPYIVHCMEGKDRTGYVCALLEGLCGATYDEIVADYLVTYENYYRITPQKDKELCNALVTMRLNPCLMYYAGVDDETMLPSVDFAKTFSYHLLSHGMSRQEVDALVLTLTVP